MAIQGKFNGKDTDIKATDGGHLVTDAVITSEIFHVALDGGAFAFHVTQAAIDTTDTVLFLRNDDTALFFPDRCTFNADDDAAMVWQIRLGKAITTPSGGALTPINTYPTFSGKTFTHISLTDETGVTAGDLIEEHKLAAAASAHHVELDGVVLGKGQYIQFDIVGATPIVGMTLWGHWEE